MTIEEIVRRSSDPAIVFQLYQTIETIRKQRQIANLHRVVRYMEREFNCPPKECLQYLHQVVTDSLIVETVTVGCKGSKAGIEQEGYWIPDKEALLERISEESHDWYCFECHKPGKVISCSTCFRVYHKLCLDKPKNLHNFKCVWCKANEKPANEQERLALGKSLYFVVTQQKDYWTELAKKPDEEEHPYYNFFVHTHCDLERLQMDCHNCVFRSNEEFLAKALLIHHNYAVALGADHSLTNLAQQFVEDCEHELQELKLCRNCFYLSNTKPMKDWFCKPCDPPHQVVWAKQKGFDFWPAKVIRVEDERIDVRFFGRHHPRAWITIEAVRNISVSPATLKVKRKQHWKQACDEMKEYIRQCECALGKDEASKIILSDSPYGIGKNAKLLAAMEKVNRSSPTSNHSTPVKTTAEADVNGSVVVDDEENEAKSDILDDSEIVDENNHLATEIPSETKDKSDSPPAKRIKLEEVTVISKPISVRRSFDSEEQTILSELKQNNCGCKARYEAILMRFKDYVIESNRLDKSKMMRAAAIKSEHELDEVRSQVVAEYEDKIKELKEKHEEELREAKLRNWCRVCLEETPSPCCKNVNRCADCKDKQPSDVSMTSSQRKRRSGRSKS
uniref:Zinc finger MYND domain-containing protein 11 n=1 Tax=Phallusia mammillata TaxID=59560 RepID=A0A6F9DXR5_9ASCI|nr:zinc finger MYND domain-containing protein 11 [Phallusia mammillata]